MVLKITKRLFLESSMGRNTFRHLPIEVFLTEPVCVLTQTVDAQADKKDKVPEVLYRSGAFA